MKLLKRFLALFVAIMLLAGVAAFAEDSAGMSGGDSQGSAGDTADSEGSGDAAAESDSAGDAADSSGLAVTEITGPYEISETDVECVSHRLTLRGKMVVPVSEGDEKFPMAVLTHGFMSSNADVADIAEALGKNGIASVRFDLTGSGSSDGDYVDTTLTWQKEDILNELDFVRSLDFVDTNNLFLCGKSQGGFNSAMAAVDCEDTINALVLWYPAICIPDDFRSGRVMFAAFDPENIPEKLSVMGNTSVSRAYIEEGMSIDPLSDFIVFSKDVLIIHGTDDTIVKYDYARDLAEAYPSATLITIEGGGHGFMGDGLQTALNETVSFILSHLVPTSGTLSE